MTLTRRDFTLGTAALATLAPIPARAQAFPSRDVYFVLGYAAGSGPDLIARFFAEKLRPVLKTIVVENKPGAGGNIAAEYVVRAKPDGYTLHPTGGPSLAAAPAIYKRLAFDVGKDLTTIAMFSRQPTLLVVGPNSPAQTMEQLSAILKQKGDKASYGSAIPTARVLATFYGQAIGTTPLEVQYRTSADWINDLASGNLDFAFIDSASGMGHARQNRIRVLAVSTAERSQALPDYPTMKSNGVDVDIASWWAIYAPARTPTDILDQLHGWIVEAVKSEDAKKFLFGIGNEPWPLTRQQAHDYHLKEIKSWADYVRIAGIQPQG